MPRRPKEPGNEVWDHEKFEVAYQDWLRRNGARREDFASKAQISVSTLHRLRQPGTDPLWSIVLRVCELLGREPEDFSKF